MKFFWAFLVIALLWAWWLPPTGPEGELSARSTVVPAPPTLTRAEVRAWSEEALDWTKDEEPDDPMVLCGLDAGGEAYLRRTDCVEQGTPRTEPGWALLD